MDIKKLALQCLPIMIIMILVQVLAIALIAPYSAAVSQGTLPQTFSNPDDSQNMLQFLLSVFAVTAVVLIIAKLKLGWLIKIIIHFVIFANLITITLTLSSVYYPDSNNLQIAALIGSFLLTVLLYFYPEWYIIDIVGIGISASFGYLIGGFMSATVAIILLLVFSVYDLIAVFLSKHMVALASTAIDLKLPLIFVIPPSLKYSYVKDKINIKSHSGVQLMGFGDAVFPAIMAVIAQITNGPLVALGVLIGTLVGCVLLEYTLLRFARPLPALPFLCPCAILGYEIMHFIV